MNFGVFVLFFGNRVLGDRITGNDIIVSTHLEFGFLRRFPVVFDTVQGPIDGYASLALGWDRDTFQIFSFDSTDDASIDAMSWSVSNETGSVNISTTVAVNQVDESHCPTAQISGSFNSAFGRCVDSYIISPVSQHTGQLIIRPVDPTRYAYGGEIFYASRRILHIRRNHEQSIIPVAIRVLPNDAPETIINAPVAPDEFFDCALEHQDRFLIIPQVAFYLFVTELNRLGIEHEEDPETDGLILRSMTNETISSLPMIQYLVLTDDDSQISIQILSPTQYLLESYADPATQFVMLNTGRVECDLTASLMNRMFIHMDITGNRIGFGEPLTIF